MMKNFTRLFIATILLATISSCAEDKTSDTNNLFDTTTLTMALEDSADDSSRTSLGNKSNNSYPVHWSVGDQVSVNGYASQPLTEIRYNPSRVSFDFVGDVGGTPYKASYPATDEAGKVLFATEQSYVENSFSNGAAPMYGESNNTYIAMKHAAGVLKLPLLAKSGESITLDRVTITNPNGMLSGLYTAKIVEGEVVVTPTGFTSKSVVYKCNDLALSSSKATNLFIAIPAGIYESLEVRVITTDSKIMEFKITAPASHPIVAGEVREFNTNGNIVFSNNDTSYHITDSKTLMAFADMCENCNFDYSKAILMNDVTFDDKTYDWTPITGFDFDCEFDGGGYTITGLTDAMFNIATGDIHDLTLNSKISKSNVTPLGIFANKFHGTMSECTAKGSVTITGIKQNCYLGGIIGDASGEIAFTGVNNESTMTYTITGSSVSEGPKPYIGGLVGHTGAYPATFTNCTTSGSITVQIGSISNDLAVAGFVGNVGGSGFATFNGCTSGCTINVNSACQSVHFGGFVGTSGSTMFFDDCKRNAPLTVAGSANGDLSVGGFAGYFSYGIKLTNCENTANATIKISTITVSDDNNYYIGGFAAYSNVKPANSASVAYGNMTTFQNCTNNGNITVDAAAGTNNDYLTVAGIIGRANREGAKLIDCDNYGTITILSPSTSSGKTYNAKVVCQGGLIGLLATTDAGHQTDVLSNLTNYGKIRFFGKASDTSHIGGIGGLLSDTGTTNCSSFVNESTGAILLNGTVNSVAYTGEAPYMRVGGVVGTVQCDINGASNYADQTFTGKASTTYYAGGVVGYASTAALTSFANHATTTTFNGEGTLQFYVGGVGGWVEKGDVTTITNNSSIVFNMSAPTGKANNSGNAQYDGCMMGGVFANLGLLSESTLYKAKDITNNGEIDINSSNVKGDYIYIGGCVGNQKNYSVDNADNNGVINYNESALFTTFTNANTGVCFGGVFGGVYPLTPISGCKVENCDNTKAINFKSKQHNINHMIGGVVGRLRLEANELYNCTNDGKLNFTSTFGATSSGKSFYIGGICGYVYAAHTINKCENKANGDIIFNNARKFYFHFVGGIVGFHYQPCGIIYSTNRGNIEFGQNSVASNRKAIVGGILSSISYANKTYCENCANYGNIIMPSNCGVADANCAVGGIFGQVVAKSTSPYLAKDCTYNATINAPFTKVGCITGETYDTAAGYYTPTDTATEFPIMDCIIDGAITKKTVTVTNLNANNFANYIYSTIPTVASWKATATLYHGNKNQ